MKDSIANSFLENEKKKNKGLSAEELFELLPKGYFIKKKDRNIYECWLENELVMVESDLRSLLSSVISINNVERMKPMIEKIEGLLRKQLEGRNMFSPNMAYIEGFLKGLFFDHK